jgi:hypothetical protein
MYKYFLTLQTFAQKYFYLEISGKGVTLWKITTHMIKLSEIIKTDCYIDCGSNEKLREVYPLIELPEIHVQSRYGIFKDDKFIKIKHDVVRKVTLLAPFEDLPIHHISQIDLNQ